MQKTLLVLAMAAIVVAGCTRTRVNEGTGDPVYVPGPEHTVRYNSVSFTDAPLENRIAVIASDWQRTATGNAAVWAQLRNRTDYRYTLEARAQFFDADKAPVGQISGWKRLDLGPNETATYRENSTSPNVAYYFIEVRESR